MISAKWFIVAAGGAGVLMLWLLEVLAEPAPLRRVTVPDFLGHTVTNARIVALREGLATELVRDDELGPTGGNLVVVAQNLPAGSRVRRSTTVILTVKPTA